MVDMAEAAQGTDMTFSNHEASGNIMKDGDGNSIPGITGQSFLSSNHLGVNGYTALQLLAAEAQAEGQGYSLKLYEGYHPNSVTDALYDNGHSAGISTAYLSNNANAHDLGLAVDVALCNGSGSVLLDSGRDIYILGDSSAMSNNGSYSNTLKNIMTANGLNPITNETMWWHFQTADAGTSETSLHDFTNTLGKTINFQLSDYVDKSSDVGNGHSLDDMSDVAFHDITHPGYQITGTESGSLRVDSVKNAHGSDMQLGTYQLTPGGSEHRVRNFYITHDGKTFPAFCTNFGLHGYTGLTYELVADRDGMIADPDYGKNVSDLLCLAVYCYNNKAGEEASSQSPSVPTQGYRALTQSFIWIATTRDDLADAVMTDPLGTYETIDGSTNITNAEYFISLALYNQITGAGGTIVFSTLERAVHQAVNGNTGAFSQTVGQTLAASAGIGADDAQDFIMSSQGMYAWLTGDTSNVAVKNYHDGVIDGSIGSDKLNIWLWSTNQSGVQEMLTYKVKNVPVYVALEVNKVDKDGNTLSADDMQYIKFTATYEGVDYEFTPDTANSKFLLNLTGLIGAPLDPEVNQGVFTIKVKESYTDAGLALAENVRPKIDDQEHTYTLSLTSDGVRLTEAEALAEPYKCTNILGYSPSTFPPQRTPFFALFLYNILYI